MTIEFPCTQCQRVLSVPPESAGKKAKCPSCSAVLDIPSAPTPFAGGAMAPSPYAPPAETSAMPLAQRGEIQHQIFDPIQCVSDSWQLFTANAGILIGATVITMGISLLLALGSGVLQAAGQENQSGALLVASMIVDLVGRVIQTFVTIGMLRICLAIARGERTDIGMLFSGGPYFWRYLGASILFGLATIVGLILLIIPGIYVALTYWPSLMLVIDKDSGVFESFEIAGTVAKGNRINSLVLGFLGGLINLVGLLMCGVGLLAALPIVQLMGVTAYLAMTGQRTVLR